MKVKDDKGGGTARRNRGPRVHATEDTGEIQTRIEEEVGTRREGGASRGHP